VTNRPVVGAISAAMPGTAPDSSLQSLDSRVRAELLKGMRVPQPIVLRAGATVVRFANSATWSDRWARSPWWLDESSYQHLEAARRHSLNVHADDPARAMTLGLLAKQALAVRQRWGDGPPNLMDMVIRAEIVHEVQAFAGRGHTQYETAPNGFRVTWTGWSSIQQLFIPALAMERGPAVGPWGAPDPEPVVRVRQCIKVLSQQLF
jgi:hypothetical protein